MIVFAFDRDLTVDSSPDPGPVRLTWIQWLARRTGHEVWAIGNQLLKAEASIPGRVEIRERAGMGPKFGKAVNSKELLGQIPKKQRNVASKRKYLKLLQQIIPDADRYICVDDFDISCDGWEYFTPYAFVLAWPLIQEAAAEKLNPDIG